MSKRFRICFDWTGRESDSANIVVPCPDVAEKILTAGYRVNGCETKLALFPENREQRFGGLRVARNQEISICGTTRYEVSVRRECLSRDVDTLRIHVAHGAVNGGIDCHDFRDEFDIGDAPRRCCIGANDGFSELR